MLPKTSPEANKGLVVGSSGAAEAETRSPNSSPSYHRLSALAARILGVAMVLATSTLVASGMINPDSGTVLLVAFAVVALLAAILVRSWWALLVVPLASTVGFCGSMLGVFLVESSSHGGPDIHDPAQLVAGLIVGTLIWSVLPALIGALVGTLAWRGWSRWRGKRATLRAL